jgi:Na+/melibiose symporter-like transporter
VIAPIVIIGALLFMREGPRLGRRTPIDALGAFLVALGMFGLVFGLSQSGAYGWGEPLKPFTLAGSEVWPVSMRISPIPVTIAFSLLVLLVFRAVERRKERRNQAPLFEFGQLRHAGFRYGLLVTLLLTIGQFGVVFIVPVFLQSAKHLSAETTGLWLVPMGISIIFGAQGGSRLTRRIGTAAVVRLGLVVEAAGVLVLAVTVSPTVHFVAIMAGLTLFGLGLGAANSQVTNVVLLDVEAAKSGVASGAATAVRQAGNALGIAIIGSLLTSVTISRVVELINGAGSLPVALRDRSVSAVRELGSSFATPSGTSAGNARLLDHLLTAGEATAARYALFAAAAFLLLAALVALKLPRHEPAPYVVVLMQEDDVGLSLPTELTPTSTT